MRQATRKGLMTVAAATGVIAAASGAAHATTGSAASGSTSGSPGVLSGNTVQAPVHAPVNVCGNTVNVIGVLNPSVGNSCANGGGGSGSSGGYGDSGDHNNGGGSHAGGHAADSPGVGSGNHVQAPIHVPVNACGNSVSVVGVGNAASGNDCANGGGHDGGGSHAGGHAADSPGVGSGNHVQAPIHVPVNACGNSVSVIGAGNAASGNDCANGGGHETPGHPGQPGTPGNPADPGEPGHPGNPAEPGHPGTPGTPPASSETQGGSSHGNQPGAQSISQPKGAAQLAHTGSDLPMGAVLPVGAGALLAGAVLYRKARASA